MPKQNIKHLKTGFYKSRWRGLNLGFQLILRIFAIICIKSGLLLDSRLIFLVIRQFILDFSIFMKYFHILTYSCLN